MVRYGVQALLDRQTQSSDSQTFKYDLPSKGGLSGLDLILRATNGGTSNLDHWLPETISKIEIIGNGDQRLFSMSGEEAFRYFWWKNGIPADYNFTEYLSEKQKVTFPLRFGRFLGDQLYGLDLSKFQNIQLAIEYNLATGGAVGATGFLTSTMEISAQMHITEVGKTPSYRGMITPREFYTWTSSASGEKEVELPSQWPLLGYMIYAREEATSWLDTVVKQRLSLDNDARQPYRGRIEHQLAALYARLTERSLKFKLMGTDAGTKHVPMDPIKALAFNIPGTTWVTGSVDGLTKFMAGTFSADTITLQGQEMTYAKAGVVSSAVAASSLDSCEMIVHGYPGQSFYRPLGDENTFEDLLSPSEWSDAKVIIEEGNAGASCALIVEEIRPPNGGLR